MEKCDRCLEEKPRILSNIYFQLKDFLGDRRAEYLVDVMAEMGWNKVCVSCTDSMAFGN